MRFVELEKKLIDFLDTYGGEIFLGRDFAALVGLTDRQGTAVTPPPGGARMYRNLLRALGTESEDFLRELTERLKERNHHQNGTISVGGHRMPPRFLMAALEQILPGEELISIKKVEQFEEQANLAIPPQEREKLQRVIDTYPVRLSKHVIRQARLSPHIAYQFMPFVEELDEEGLKNTWVGQFHRGLIEQMYQNRPIFVLHMSCPVYCRFCFRKHKDTRNQPAPTVEDVDQGVEYIRHSPRIKEIVLTGGEPLMNRRTLLRAVEGLKDIPHIQTIRIASRCISYYPQMFFKDEEFWLNYLIETNRELAPLGKRIEIATHFIHPDEISPRALEIISRLVASGLQVYTQTPFLNNCNDTGAELVRLYRELRGVGSELHYIYIPASPIQGNRIYWTPLAKGHRAYTYLRGRLSDRAMPILCTATKIGKIDWNASGWAVERSREHPENVWIRTPYYADYYRDFVPDFRFEGARENDSGTLDVEFMAEAGDESLFRGAFDGQPAFTHLFDWDKLSQVQEEIRSQARLDNSITDTGHPALYRSHLTRVDVDLEELFREEGRLASAVDYIRREEAVSDVVIASEGSLLRQLERIEELARALWPIPHVNALRLRSTAFTYQPEEYQQEMVERIAALQRLEPKNPTRVEVEAQFIHSSEFQGEHQRLVSQFLARGVTVYNNVVLLSGINDDVEEMKKISYQCRQIGIELFQLYVAGLPIQRRHNRGEPIEATTVINIATNLRRHQSGREVPLYVLRTPVGEVDFNLTGLISASGENWVELRLLPYSLEYFRTIDLGFELPEGVTEKGSAEAPLVARVEGLTVQSNRDYFIQSSFVS